MTVLHDLYKQLDSKHQLLLEIQKLIATDLNKRNYYVQQEYSLIQDRNKLAMLIKYIEKVESFDLIKLVKLLAEDVKLHMNNDPRRTGNTEYVIQEIEQYLNTGKEVT